MFKITFLFPIKSYLNYYFKYENRNQSKQTAHVRLESCEVSDRVLGNIVMLEYISANSKTWKHVKYFAVLTSIHRPFDFELCLLFENLPKNM